MIRRIRWPGWTVIIVVSFCIFFVTGSLPFSSSEAVTQVKFEADHQLKQTVLSDKGVPEMEKEEVLEKEVFDPLKKYIALTFDDGPHAKVTPQVLKVLEEKKVKATFFMLGIQAEKNQAIAKAVADAGHEIGNHTNFHHNLTKLDSHSINKDIAESASKIEIASGIYPEMMRPPYGKFDEKVEEAAAELGSSIILWSVDSQDWKTKNAHMIKKEVLEKTLPGSIILMHDIHQATAEALPDIIAYLQKEGFEFVTVTELLSLSSASKQGPYYKVKY